jgi:hypothetical protein
MFVTKKDLIDLGFPADHIISSPVPVTIINDVTMMARSIKVQKISDVLKETFVQDCKAIGYLFICEPADNANNNDQEIWFRYFSVPSIAKIS